MKSKIYEPLNLKTKNMSKTKILMTAICVSILSITSVFAQTKNEKKTEKVEIKTSAVCGMCKSTIEKALSKEEGVDKSKLDVKTKTVEVTYDPAKTSPEKIKKAITMAGYDADNMPADSSAYGKLHDCCKKDGKH